MNIVEKAGNYGWRLKEGTPGFDLDTPKESPQTTLERNDQGERLIDCSPDERLYTHREGRFDT